MEFHKLAPYRWQVMDLSRLEGDLFERDGAMLVHVYLRTDLGKTFGGATIAMGRPAMTEAEFDAWAERFLRENERAVLRHLARLFRAGDEPTPATDPERV